MPIIICTARAFDATKIAKRIDTEEACVKNWKPLRYVAKRKNVLPGFIKKETTTRLELDIS